MAIRVDKVIKQYNEVVRLLADLVCHVEEDIPREQGTKHLWTTVDDVNELLCGPTSSYVDQD
jgi:hypothetical protein|tara:strand:- start:162 stop:347 length:186 start_codon:yes stop_codon:yes gene_type:complete